MKVKIVNSFKDARTEVIHGAGEIIEMSEERIAEIEENTKTLVQDGILENGAILIEKVPEQKESSTKQDDKGTKEGKRAAGSKKTK